MWKIRLKHHISLLKAHEKLICRVFMAELSEAGKKFEKNRTEGRCSFFPLAMAVWVLDLIKKASLNDSFWISFFTLIMMVEFVFSAVVHNCDSVEKTIVKISYFDQDFP